METTYSIFGMSLNLPLFIINRKQTNDALNYSRKGSRPSMIIWNRLPRRFGHAATDRQFAYLTEEQIKSVARRNPVEYMCAQLVDLGVTTYQELENRYMEIWEKVGWQLSSLKLFQGRKSFRRGCKGTKDQD